MIALTAPLAAGYLWSDAPSAPPKSSSSSKPRPFSCDEADRNASVFCEDWSSGYIDKTRWTHEIGATGGGNAEFQIYSQHPQNSFVRDGTLHIRPTFTYNTLGDLRGDLDLDAQGCVNNWNNGCRNMGTLHAEAGNPGGKMWEAQQMIPVGGLRQSPVMSAKLMTKQAFRYGRIEFTATLPRGDYLWPALWMLPQEAGPWPTGGEIDVMESMGNDRSSNFDLDPNSTSAAVHFGAQQSWYDVAYTPTFEKLLEVPTGSQASRRALSAGPHVFGVHWTADNMYMYVDADANRVLDMDVTFRLKAKEMIANGDDTPLAREVAEFGYRAGWRKYAEMTGKPVPSWLWQEAVHNDAHDAPFDKPFYLIMNLAVGGNFFGANGGLNPDDKGVSLFDVHPKESGQLPAQYWYSRMNQWWSTWAADESEPLPEAFASAPVHRDAYFEPENRWHDYAYGGQDAGMSSTHKADTLTNKAPPSDDQIGDHVDFKIHRVIVYPAA